MPVIPTEIAMMAVGHSVPWGHLSLPVSRLRNFEIPNAQANDPVKAKTKATQLIRHSHDECCYIIAACTASFGESTKYGQ